MKCPYDVNSKLVTHSNMTYDDNGTQTDWMEVQNNKAEFTECLKEECGVYNAEKRKCEYKHD